jgi:hypothetical protein
VNSPNDRVFRSRKKLEFMFVQPNGRDITAAQEQYLTNYLSEFESVLFSDQFGDPQKGYRRYIDVGSFVDYHWMQELGKNPDGYWFSEFYHKDRGGKLKIGPIWDFDMCFGNTWYNDGHLPQDWRWRRATIEHYLWYKRLFKDPDFLQRYIDRWTELRTNVLSTSNVLALVDRFAAELQEAQKRNYQRWPTLGKKVGPVKFVGKTYEEEVNWLKEWIKGRLDWIDSQGYPGPVVQIVGGGNGSGTNSPSPLPSPHPMGRGERNAAPLIADPHVREPGRTETNGASPLPSTVRMPLTRPAGTLSPSDGERDGVRGPREPLRYVVMACLDGKIYYTLDGSDPRLPGGTISPKALEYKEAIPFQPDLCVMARVRSDFGLWSAPAVVKW